MPGFSVQLRKVIAKSTRKKTAAAAYSQRSRRFTVSGSRSVAEVGATTAQPQPGVIALRRFPCLPSGYLDPRAALALAADVEAIPRLSSARC